MGQIIKSVLFDFGNTLVLDPFDEALNRSQNDFEIVLRNGQYDISVDMLIAVWMKYNKDIHGYHFSHLFQEAVILDQVLRSLNVISNREQLITALLNIYRSKVLSVISKSTLLQRQDKY